MNLNPEKLNDLIKAETQRAQEYAKDLHVQINFDHPENGLVTLEEIMDIYADDIQTYQDIPDADIKATAIMFGACLGELLLEHRLAEVGFAWTNDNSRPVPYLRHPNNEAMCSPIERSYARLVNGRQDDFISYFYNIIQYVNTHFYD